MHGLSSTEKFQALPCMLDGAAFDFLMIAVQLMIALLRTLRIMHGRLMNVDVLKHGSSF